jgi:hypothetical protein
VAEVNTSFSIRIGQLISVPSGSSVFVDLLGPPMELRGRADAIRSPLQSGAMGQLGVFELLDAGKMPVDEHVVGEGPEMFSGLQLWRIRWQEEQVDVLGHLEPLAGVPARTIQDQDDLLAGAGADRRGEGDQLDCEERDADRGGEMEARAARGGLHETHEGAPGEAVAHHGDGALPFGSPDPPQEWLQADAVFVGRPEFDGRLREGVGDRRHERTEVFLQSACCSASARA